MIPLEDFKKNFVPHEVPAELVQLLGFFNTQQGFFSSGFELAVDDISIFKTWCDKPEFVECLYPIGMANGSGSTYAIWRRVGALCDSPIVVFGDEGGVHVVASNVIGLLRILTLDAEPMIDQESVTYYKADDDEASDGASEYAEWVAEQLKLKAVTGMKEVEQIIDDAQKRFATEFKAWMEKFCDA